MFVSGTPRNWSTLKKIVWLKRMTGGGGGGGEITTVTGISPLLLANALHKPIHKLTQYGRCVQDGTPTPDAPVDIVCNNGVLRYGALGSNLYDPSTAVFEVGYYYNPNADGAQTAASNNFIYHSYIPIEAGAAYVFYGRQKDTNRISQYNRIHWYDEEKTYIATNTYTAGVIGRGVAPDNAVYAKLSCNPQGASTGITEETVLNYNWTFCKGTAEVTPFVPFVGGIYTDGTPETLTIEHNLYDPNGVDPNHYYDANGVYTETQTTQLSNRVPVKRGDIVVCKTTTVGTGQSTNIRYNQLNASGEWVSQEVQSQSRNTTLTKTVTINQDGFFVFSGTMTGTTYVDFDATVITIESETQTVSVPMLLGVGPDDRDEVELVHGPLTHRIGLFVITGSDDEGWAENSSYAGTFYADCLPAAALITTFSMFTRYEGVLGSRSVGSMANGTAKCGSSSNRQRIFIRDVSCADVDALKEKLSGFYADGEPCIVAFVLATEQTEQGTAHALHTSAGTNVVDVSAAVGSVEMEVEFVQAAGG